MGRLGRVRQGGDKGRGGDRLGSGDRRVGTSEEGIRGGEGRGWWERIGDGRRG